MSLIQINDLSPREIDFIVPISTIQLDRVRGGSNPSAANRSYSSNPQPTDSKYLPLGSSPNLINNLGTSISYAFGQSQYQTTAAGPFSITIGANFTGTYSANGNNKPFTTNVYYDVVYPTSNNKKQK
jgi:hypothetical protein